MSQSKTPRSADAERARFHRRKAVKPVPRHDARYTIRTTGEGKERAEKFAAEAGFTSLSDYVRAVAEREPVRTKQAARDVKALRAIHRELQAEGNNLNQLMHRAHVEKNLPVAKEVSSAMEKLLAVWERVIEL